MNVWTSPSPLLFHKIDDMKLKNTHGNIKHVFIIAIIKAKSLKQLALIMEV